VSEIRQQVDELASPVDYASHAEEFLQLDRWTGSDPLLLVADAAGTTTGQSYFDQVKPSVESFQSHSLESGRVETFADLASLNRDDSELQRIFEAERKRRVLVETAAVLTGVDGETDLDRLQRWARRADPYNYSEDPVGRIDGVGLRTFQYLRMIAGVDTVKPDVQVRKFVENWVTRRKTRIWTPLGTELYWRVVSGLPK
jgi:hypothetical protein